MRTKLTTGLGLAICLAASISTVQAQTTQQILQMRTFREGLVWIGDKEPNEAENKELLQVLGHLQQPEWRADLERFLRDHPASPWAASLHYDYASFCRRTGRTTKALEHFEAAWNCAKDDTSAAGKRLSGTVLANWTDLLSSLGRLDELKRLVAIGDRWHFVNAADGNKFQGAKHSYLLMQQHPEMAYRCGTFALKAVGGVMEPTNQMLEGLVAVPSPTNGFSIAGLLDLAKKYGLNLVAVRRTAGQDLIVPSVVHWRQNHYAAILRKRDEFYLVSDPTFGREQWLSAEVINQEASGEFLIPTGSQTDGWTQLAINEAKAIHGMGLPNDIKDGKDQGCKPGGPCPPCENGMPVWWVSEPYINLWMADEPLSYLTSRGDPVTLRLSYKQRDSRPAGADERVSTAGWNNSWSSYIHLVSEFPCGQTECPPSFADCEATVYLPNGGEIDFGPGQTYDSENRIGFQEVFSPSGATALSSGVDNGARGVEIIHADGSVDVYGTCFVFLAQYGGYPEAECLLSRHISPSGDTTYFEHAAVNPSAYVLTFVIDPDGRTNTLSYTSQNLLSSVTNAYGQSAHLLYDSHGNLTNIVDAQGLSSSIAYDASNNPTALITPYGTNTFAIYQNSTVTNTNDPEGNFGGDAPPLIDRAILVTDPVGANYLYLYQNDAVNLVSSNYSASLVPTNTPLGTLETGTDSGQLAAAWFRNSFYWGPRQYPNLSTTNMFSFTANDYLRGRMQHWLEDTNQLYLTEFLSVRQEASPDGSTAGLLTFYDYQGKLPGYNFCEGTNALPSVAAWRLPNGETHYEYSLFDSYGHVTNDITTYTLANGSVGARTNRFVYVNNTYTYSVGNGSINYTIPDLLTKVIGPDGNTIWAYGGFDTVTWSNVFFGGNGATLVSSRVLPDYATNGLGQVATNAYTSTGIPVNFYDLNPVDAEFGSNVDATFSGYNKVISSTSVAGLTTTNFYNTNGFLTRTIDLQTGRTNSFGYSTDGLIGTWTNELGLNLTFTWDNLLRPTGAQFPDGTYTSNSYTRLDLTARRDRLGNFTHYGYDGARHLIAITNANTAVWQFDWCGCGALTATIDPLNNTNSFNYDNQGNLTNISYPDGSALNYQYDLAARRTVTSDGAGRALQFGYNNQGLVTSVSNAFGRVQGIFYDIRDRQATVTDANNISVTNGFDLLDRVTTRTWPDSIAERFGYSAQGLAFYTNRDNKITEYGRDAAGRLTSITNANNEVIQTTYDPAGDITNLVDGLSHTRSWQYNQFGWLTNKVDGLSRTALQYAYNANGWITNRFTPEKGNTGYTYDNVGNLKTINYPLSTINFSYDPLNRLTNMVDLSGTSAFSYTAIGQLASETGPWANDTVSYTYSQRLRTALNLAQSSGSWSQSYGYDSMWRLTNLVSPAGTFAYRYDFQPASPLVSEILLPNDAYVTNSYDTLARLNQTALNNYWGHTLDSYTYQDDPLGLRTNIVRNLGLTTSTVSAGYDAIAQLTSWSAKESGGALRQNEQLAFGYDSAHNLHTRNNGALAQTFNVDAADELTNVIRSGTFTFSGATPAPATNISVNGQTAQIYGDFAFASTNNTLANGSNTFTVIAQNLYGVAVTNTLTANLPASISLEFDDNGNLTNDGTRSFLYDAENQLTNISVAGRWRSDFVYDGLNRRRIARDYSWGGSAWVETNEIRYIYDRELVIQERETNNNVLVTYTRGRDFGGGLQGAGGIGGLLARTDGSGSFFYHADGSGNITALIDGRQNIVARYEYDPFGQLIGKWGAISDANRYRFSSKEYHPNSGLYYYGFRYYAANLQRWLNQDPIQEFSGINLYRFARNNSLRYVDSIGLQENGFGLKEADEDPNEQQAEQNYNGLDPDTPEKQAADEAVAQAAADQRVQQEADDARAKAAEAVKLPDSQGSEGDNALPKTAKSPKPCPRQRTPQENREARQKYKNNKDAAKQAYTDRTGNPWPKDNTGRDWPGHHPTPLKEWGDPMVVVPQDPNGPDPHNVAGPDGLTDYQRWGALGPSARDANK